MSLQRESAAICVVRTHRWRRSTECLILPVPERADAGQTEMRNAGNMFQEMRDGLYAEIVAKRQVHSLQDWLVIRHGIHEGMNRLIGNVVDLMRKRSVGLLSE